MKPEKNVTLLFIMTLTALFFNYVKSLRQNHPYFLVTVLATMLIRKDCGFWFSFVGFFNQINASPLISIWLILLSASRQGLRRECKAVGGKATPPVSHRRDEWLKRGWEKRREKKRWLLQMEQGQRSDMMRHYWITPGEYGLWDSEDKSKDYVST